jgi:tetratricopeptide (TPR) repeat protein
MALGFGFNKQKVLASAEKYVQQGKLTNAIAEYEKILEKDPKDLTVLNTIGDLYARDGNASKASEYYTRVGDSYAQQGFTLRAIAMYKKVTKLDPSSLSMVQKLAELYTQQGLLNDARQQYLILADSAQKKNDYDGASRIFEKMLESDPDNAAIQGKLADIYVRLGKKDKARDLLFRIATALSERRSMDAAIDALNRLLHIDATNTEALLLRGKIALDAGDTAGGIKFLERVPTIDSLPQGLHSLLRAYLNLNKYEESEPLARKLLSVHNDSSGIREYATSLVTSGNGETALRIYDEFSSTLLAGDSTEVILALQPLIGQLKDQPASLETLRNIFEKAGASSSVPEINELLAHAYVQAGELEKARDLYQGLAEVEPGNPLHMQNYRQVMTRLGQDVAARPTEPEEGDQAFFIEELAEQTGPSLQQSYAPVLAESINSALTESELYESYGKTPQAIHLLESALAKAPEDVRLNQRLASIYLRNSRPDDAAKCYRVLSQIFSKVGKPEEAAQYSEYAARCGGTDTAHEAAPTPAEQAVRIAITPEPAAEHPIAQAAPVIEPAEEITVEADIPAFEITPPSHADADAGESHEIDLSAEWEAAVSDEPVVESAAAEVHLPPAPEPVLEAKLPEPEEAPVSPEAPHPSVVSDLLEEIKFYISQSMLDEARVALERLRELSPENGEIPSFQSHIEVLAAAASVVEAANAPAEEVQEPEVEEIRVGPSALDDGLIENLLSDHSPNAEFELPVPEAQPIAAQTAPITDFELDEPEEPAAEKYVEPEHIPGIVHELAPITEEQPVPEATAALKKGKPAAEFKIEPEHLLDIEEEVPASSSAPFEELVSEPAPAPVPEEEEEEEPEPVVLEPEEEPEPKVAAASHSQDVLSDFVLDLESSLGNDFLSGGNGSSPLSSPGLPGSGPSLPSIPVIPTPSIPTHAAAASSTISTSPAAATAVAAAPEVVPAESDETVSPLSELFAEFKEEVEEGSSDKEDPETHYNLGVAFKEMGLLDEAISELQKVCAAIDHGQPFGQVIQAYTWLAHCFVEKGIPEAGIKWYEKALQVPGDQETHTAVEYELACACEAAGDRKLALQHFMEVYGSNIDYRDVSERIKTLKA